MRQNHKYCKKVKSLRRALQTIIFNCMNGDFKNICRALFYFIKFLNEALVVLISMSSVVTNYFATHFSSWLNSRCFGRVLSEPVDLDLRTSFSSLIHFLVSISLDGYTSKHRWSIANTVKRCSVTTKTRRMCFMACVSYFMVCALQKM